MFQTKVFVKTQTTHFEHSTVFSASLFDLYAVWSHNSTMVLIFITFYN